MIKNILAIDDDLDILDAIKFALEIEGYNVKTSKKGEYAESLHSKVNNLPDLIILDVLLSGKDGRSICKKLKKQKDTKNIPIIMISAHPDAQKSSIEVGANEFLAKPFNVSVLLEKIQKLIH